MFDDVEWRMWSARLLVTHRDALLNELINFCKKLHRSEDTVSTQCQAKRTFPLSQALIQAPNFETQIAQSTFLTNG